MHPALLWLLRRRQWAFWRRTIAGLKTPRGALLLAATATFFAMIVLPQFIAPLLGLYSPQVAESNRQFAAAAQPAIRTLMPLFLLAFVMLSVGGYGESAIYFSPADVDFLFPGPFSRRDLLLYKLAQSLRSALFAGTFFAIMAARYAPLLAGAWLGSVLTLLFLNGCTLTMTLATQIVTQQANTRWRRLALGAVALLIVAGLAATIRNFDVGDPIASIDRFRQSPAGAILTAPFNVFPRIITAPNLAELLLWTALAVAMVLGLFSVAIGLDANYLELAQRVSQRHYERLQRRRQGGGAIAAMPIGGAQRLRLPRPPWLGGVGPNLWRQSLLLVRRSQGLMMLVVIAVVMGVLLVVLRRQSKQEIQFFMAPTAVLAALAYQSFLASMQLPAGFRGDIDRLDWLKSLPLHPLAVVAGEVSGAALLLSVVQAVMLLAAWAFCGGAAQIYLSGLVALVPVNLLLFGVENLIFLIFPLRVTTATAGDFQFMGRYTLLAMFKMLILAACLLIASAGAIVYLIVPQLWLAVACSTLLLLGIDGMVMLLASYAFTRFDISLDTPPA